MKGDLTRLAPKDQIHTIPEDPPMQQQTGGAHPRPRIETLADLIFGLSLSIGSIALIANPPKKHRRDNNPHTRIRLHVLCAHHSMADLYYVHVCLTNRDKNSHIPQRGTTLASCDVHTC